MAFESNSSVCIHHPGRPAVAHCAVCRKPVCEECLVERDGFRCCSEGCLEQAVRSTAAANAAMRSKKRGNGASVVRNIILLLILIAIGACGYVFREDLGKLFRKSKGTLQQKTQQLQQQPRR